MTGNVSELKSGLSAGNTMIKEAGKKREADRKKTFFHGRQRYNKHTFVI